MCSVDSGPGSRPFDYQVEASITNSLCSSAISCTRLRGEMIRGIPEYGRRPTLFSCEQRTSSDCSESRQAARPIAAEALTFPRQDPRRALPYCLGPILRREHEETLTQAEAGAFEFLLRMHRNMGKQKRGTQKRQEDRDRGQQWGTRKGLRSPKSHRVRVLRTEHAAVSL